MQGATQNPTLLPAAPLELASPRHCRLLRRLALLGLCLLSLPVQAVRFPVAWGAPYDIQARIPTNLTEVVQIVAAGDATLALKPNGTVVAWGRAAVTNVPSGLTSVTAISAEEELALALRQDGTVVAWGKNWHGTISDVTNAIAVAAGANHAVVLLRDGTVRTWKHGYGVVAVDAGLTNVTAVAAAGGYSLALKGEGTVVAWGSLTNVPPDLSGVAAIAAGPYHCLALKSNGTVVAWSKYIDGKTDVPPGLSNVTAIAAGNLNIAVRSDGSFVAWGNPHGYAAKFPRGLTNVTAVSIGLNHAVAVNDGSPYLTSEPVSWTVYSGSTLDLTGSALGLPPLSYQWQKNGVNLPGATSPSLTLTNVQVNDSGLYRLVVANIPGKVVSTNATLEVVDSAPILSWGPRSRTVYPGETESFYAAFYGSEPLGYQWYRNGTAIPGATNSSLHLSNVQVGDEGTYSVIASNTFGQKASEEAVLNVLDLSEVLGTTNLLWTTAGNAAWFPTYDWDYKPTARSGVIADNQSSILRTAVTGPGTLSFAWWVYSQPTADYLSFSINGVEQARISGSVWRQSNTFHLGPGEQNLEWAYVKDSEGISSQDAAGLRELVYLPGATLPAITKQPASLHVVPGGNARFEVTAHGTPSLRYQWTLNWAHIEGATNAALLLTNLQAADQGTYRAVVSNPFGSTLSAPAVLDLFEFIGPRPPQDYLDRWWYRNPLLPRRICFAQGLFIGLGADGMLATSADGRVWTQQVTGTTNELRGVAAAGEGPSTRFVVVGSRGTILTSPDATNWTRVVTPYTCHLNDVAASGSGTFVASTTRSTTAEPNVLVSSDGLNWTGKTFPNGGDLGLPYFTSVVLRGKSNFIATGGSMFAYEIWRSATGNTWTYAGFSDQVVSGIAQGNDRIIMVGWEGWPRVSTNDGSSWYYVTNDVISPGAKQPPYYMSPMVGSDIAYGNGTFVVARYDRKTGLLLTTDAADWNSRSTFTGMQLDSVAYGNGTFVGVVSDGGSFPTGIYQSEPAATPSLRGSGTPGSMRLQVSGEIGQAYCVQFSTNLVDWTDRFTVTNSAPSVEILDPVVPGAKQLFYRVIKR